MKVILLNDFGFVNGGAAQVAITEALGLADRGIEVTYLCGIGPVDERLLNHPNIQAYQVDGFDVLTEPNRIKAALKGTWNHQSANYFKRILASTNHSDTLVHLHGWHRSLSPSVSALIHKMGLPLICTVHDYFLACPNGGLYNFQKNEPCPLKALSLACMLEHCDPRVYRHKAWRFARTVVQKHLAKLPNAEMAFITVSEFSRKIIEPYLPDGARVFHLPNPISISKKGKVQVAQNQRYAYVGRFMIDKGPMLLAQANQDRAFKLTFIGGGPLEAQLRGAAPTAIFTGWLGHDALFKELSGARALVFPTRGYETQGMTVLEAASLGIPAVVSDSSAATSWVTDGENGLWFRQGDPEDLRRKLTMLEDDQLVARLGEAAYHRFWQNPPTPERHLEGIMAVYQKLISQNNPLYHLRRLHNKAILKGHPAILGRKQP
ncbi:MAG: glycosyltransferase family 4 protein [Anaerolineaceae bacterium]|nr:glycosyltransferase family 4 protein [Anaerolineaceae bacterium]